MLIWRLRQRPEDERSRAQDLEGRLSELIHEFLRSRPGKPRRLFSFLGVDSHGSGDLPPLPERGACIPIFGQFTQSTFWDRLMAEGQPNAIFDKQNSNRCPWPGTTRPRSALVAELVMASVLSAEDAGSIPDGSSGAQFHLRPFRPTTARWEMVTNEGLVPRLHVELGTSSIRSRGSVRTHSGRNRRRRSGCRRRRCTWRGGGRSRSGRG